MRCPGIHCLGCKSGSGGAVIALAVLIIAAIGGAHMIAHALLDLAIWVGLVAVLPMTVLVIATIAYYHRTTMRTLTRYTESQTEDEQRPTVIHVTSEQIKQDVPRRVIAIGPPSTLAATKPVTSEPITRRIGNHG